MRIQQQMIGQSLADLTKSSLPKREQNRLDEVMYVVQVLEVVLNYKLRPMSHIVN